MTGRFTIDSNAPQHFAFRADERHDEHRLERQHRTKPHEPVFKHALPVFEHPGHGNKPNFCVQMSGTMKVGQGGSIELKEEDGLDYQATTVQMPGGERVPFLFTIKELAAKGTVNGFGGEFTVPSYRGATFLDPKGRGGATGYDNAVALPARSDSEELAKENTKSTLALKGAAPGHLSAVVV